MRPHLTRHLACLLTLTAIACDRPKATPADAVAPKYASSGASSPPSAPTRTPDAGADDNAEAASPPTTVPAPPAPPWRAAALVSTTTDTGVTLTPVTFGAKNEMTLRPPTQVDTGAHDDRGHLVAAHDGTHACVTHRLLDEDTPSTVRLHVLSTPEASPRVASAGDERPHAAFIDGRACVLGGSHASVFRADFATEPARTTVLDTRGQDGDFEIHKAVDYFVDTGDALIAVDDRVSPFYAFVFDWAHEGNGRTLATTSRRVDLPTGANLTYTGATFAGGHVVLTSRYGHRGGSGQRVEVYDAAFASSRQTDVEAAKPGVHAPWDATTLKPAIRSAESVSRRHSRNGVLPPKRDLFAGKNMTPFTGVAHLGDTLFVGAEARGIFSMRLPKKLPKGERNELGSKISRHDLGGARVLDLTQSGGVLLALLEAQNHEVELVTLSWNPRRRSLTIDQLVPMPKGTDSFVPSFATR